MTTLEHHFESAVLANRAGLLGAALRLTGSHSEAEDVVQEALTRAWAAFERFELGTNIRAWLHRIVYNTFVSRYRKRVRERRFVEAIKYEKDTIYEIRTDSESISPEVEAALMALPAHYRDAVIAVDLRDQSYREASENLSVPVGTIMSRLHRGRAALKVSLGEYAARE